MYVQSGSHPYVLVEYFSPDLFPFPVLMNSTLLWRLFQEMLKCCCGNVCSFSYKSISEVRSWCLGCQGGSSTTSCSFQRCSVRFRCRTGLCRHTFSTSHLTHNVFVELALEMQVWASHIPVTEFKKSTVHEQQQSLEARAACGRACHKKFISSISL